MLTGSSPLPPRVAIVSLHQWPENNQCIDIFSIVWDLFRNVQHCYLTLSHILTCASQLMAAHIFQDFWPRQQDLKSYIVYQTTICLLESSYNLSFKQAWPNFTFKWSSVHLLLSHWPYLALRVLHYRIVSWRTMSAPDSVFEDIHSSPTWGHVENIQFGPWSLSGTRLLGTATIMQIHCNGKLLFSVAMKSPKGSKVITRIVYLIAKNPLPGQAVFPFSPQNRWNCYDGYLPHHQSGKWPGAQVEARHLEWPFTAWKSNLWKSQLVSRADKLLRCKDNHYLCISAKVSESD